MGPFILASGSWRYLFLWSKIKVQFWEKVSIYMSLKSVKCANMPLVHDIIYLQELISFTVSKVKILGLPWWRSGWESACQRGGHGFGPWSGRIPHAAERLGPWATAAEPARLEPVLRNRRGHDNEGPAHRGEEWPPLATTGESPRTETKTQHSQK